MAIDDLNYVIDFGVRHRGSTLEDVLNNDPSYLVWAAENVDTFELSNRLYKLALEVKEELREAGVKPDRDETPQYRPGLGRYNY